MIALKPGTARQPNEYDILRDHVAETVAALDAPQEGLAPEELNTVIRVASDGVLRRLQGRGIAEAGTVAIHLGQAAEHDPAADLIYTLSERYDRTAGMREISGNAQAQQQRMSRLAKASGETAVAIVGSVLNPAAVQQLVESGRAAVDEYSMTARSKEGVETLKELLDQTEAAAKKAV